MNFIIFPLLLIVILLCFWIRWRKHRMILFQRYGIPGPNPNFFTGNLKEIIEKKVECLQEWTKKYGKVFGIYLGSKPLLLCSDLEFIKILEIKDFKHFTNRDMILPDGGISHKLILRSLPFLKDEKWKISRSISNRNFSLGKIKNMSNLMVLPINTFLKKISEQKGNTFDILKLYKKLTFDIICRTIFGFTSDVQSQEKSKFFQSAEKIFGIDVSDSLVSLSIFFSELEPLPTYLRNIMDSIRSMMNHPSARFVFESCKNIIQFRKKSGCSQQDFLHSILESEGNSINGIKKLDIDTIVADAVMFMLAGFDTSSNALSWCTYYLARHPEMQQKVRQEINDNVQKNRDIEYTDLFNFQFLDQVLSEALRITAVSIFSVSRICSEEFKYKDMTIPKDATIVIPVPLLHRDPNYWHEPNRFDPDRFSPTNRGKIEPLTYQPFGVGLRICIGMRLAQTLMKLTLANLVRAFRLEPFGSEKTEEDYSLFIIRPKNGIFVKAIPVTS